MPIYFVRKGLERYRVSVVGDTAETVMTTRAREVLKINKKTRRRIKTGDRYYF